MVSIYWLIALFSGTFYWIYFKIKKHRKIVIGEAHLIMFYFASRLILLSQLTEISKGITFNYFIDLVFLYFVRIWLKHREDSIDVASGIALYLANPLVLVSIISNRPIRMLFLCLGVLVLLVIAKIRNFRFTTERIQKLKFSFICISISGYLYTLSRDVLGANWSQCRTEDENYTILLVIGAFGAIVSWVSITYLFFRKVKSEKKEEKANETGIDNLERIEENSYQIVSITKKDWIFLPILTVLSALLIFTYIGSTKAPETRYEFNDEKHGQSQLVLDLGDYKELSSLYVFLGNQHDQRIAISSYDETTETWNVIKAEETLPYVFYWNEVEINQKVKTLRIIKLDGEGVFNEVVLLDSKGDQMLPVNAEDYPNLFDEQEKYTETATYYYCAYFDEFYHARTAYETLHGLPIYEISHPPLGKDLMSIGIRLFGMTPFGWRFIVAVFGVLLTPIIYLFVLFLTKKTKYAVAGSVLLNMDFMHFALSRIGTIDAIVAFFIITAFFLMYGFIQKESVYCCLNQKSARERLKLQRQEMIWLFLCGLSIGCGIATKWTGVYAGLALAVLLFEFLFSKYSNVTIQREEFKHLKVLFFTCVISFLCVPIIIYLLSYLPYTKTWNENIVEIVIDNFKYMLNYHKNTVFEHPYSSNWYDWVWDQKPIVYKGDTLMDGRFSFIACFGNPIIWWSGIVALFHNIYLWAVKKNRNAKYLCIAFAAMFVPWIFIHRTLFIYQYYVCSIILVLLLMNSFANLKDRRGFKLLGFISVAILVFLVLYPIISGYPINKSYIDQFL